MERTFLVLLAFVFVGTVPAWSQNQPDAPAPKPPPFETTKVEGTDHVYVFRYGNHQAMFVVTSGGVIATDPIGYGRPQAVTTYVEEIKKDAGMTKTRVFMFWASVGS